MRQPFADVLQNRCSWKFLNIHKKTPKLEPLITNDSNTAVFLWILQNFLRTAFLYRTPPLTASERLALPQP